MASAGHSTDAANLAGRFMRIASAHPDRLALILPERTGPVREMTFGQLDAWSQAYAAGFRRAGLVAGDRVLLLVRPGADFIALALALLRAGLVVVLVDPGMDRRSLLGCIERAAPVAMIGVPAVHLLAAIARRPFASVRRRWLAGLPWAPAAVERLRQRDATAFPCEPLGDDAMAAIVFTTGSTGTPKGVVYTHRNYLAQVDLIRDRFNIREGEVALPGYLPFAILCLCLGATCIVPRVDPARPGSVDAAPVADLMRRYRPAYGLGSPAFWARIAEHCQGTGQHLDSLRLLLLFGAEVHDSILRRLRALLPDLAEIHTPYGATEAQPITTIGDGDLLDTRLLERRQRLGVCVGRPFDGVEVSLVPVSDEPLDGLDGPLTATLSGKVGEVVVRSAAVTGSYFAQPDQDRLHKIGVPPNRWHRTGDCGSFDEEGRLWLAGRKAHRIETSDGTLFPLPIEARIDQHPAVRRSALVGVGPAGRQRPVLVVELDDSARGAADAVAADLRAQAAADPCMRLIADVLVHPSLPVDYRHNAKILRDQLGRWAAARLRSISPPEALRP